MLPFHPLRQWKDLIIPDFHIPEQLSILYSNLVGSDFLGLTVTSWRHRLSDDCSFEKLSLLEVYEQ